MRNAYKVPLLTLLIFIAINGVITNDILITIISTLCLTAIHAVNKKHQSISILALITLSTSFTLTRYHQNSDYAIFIIPPGCYIASSIIHNNLSNNLKSKFTATILIITFGILFANSSFELPFVKSKKTAYFSNTNWGAHSSKTSMTDIETQYSYDLLRKLIGSEDISDLTDIKSFGELWFVTPTTPLSVENIHRVRNWVAKGGTLVVVTDHTDLFGHSTIANSILEPFGITSNSDAVIDCDASEKIFTPFNYCYGLTGNSFSGRGLSWAFKPGYCDSVDYAGHSFFGDLQVTDEDQSGIHSIGMMKSFGLGKIITFGDSTQFANFAITRPSSQFFLRKIISQSIPPIFNILCILLIYHTTITFKLSHTPSICLSIILTIGIINFFENRRDFKIDKIKTIIAKGNWDGTDKPNAILSTLTASSYSCSPYILIWSMSETNGPITVGGSKISFNPTDNYFESNSEIKEILSSSKLVTSIEVRNKTIGASSKSSFWFDSGIGPLRENAYRHFWAINTKKENEPPIACEEAQIYSCTATGNMIAKANMSSIHIRNIINEKHWVVIGNWCIGKKTDDGRILIRSIWQAPGWSFGDIVLSSLNKEY